ncbi:hypothetical protein RYX36_014937 [Vicia faba]
MLSLILLRFQSNQILRQLKVKNHITIISELSTVMSIDFKKTLNGVHPSLSDSSNGAPLSISNDTLAALTGVVHSLKQEKQQRLQKVQELTKFLVELWDLMEMPIDEQKAFSHVTRLISASVDEVSIRGCLSADVEVEVQRLNVLKASKMKELVFKRHNELEEIYRGVHMDVDSEAARKILTSRIESVLRISDFATFPDFVRTVFNLIIQTCKDREFLPKTILQFYWENTD